MKKRFAIATLFVMFALGNLFAEDTFTPGGHPPTYIQANTIKSTSTWIDHLKWVAKYYLDLSL